jgi:hypothetical protein
LGRRGTPQDHAVEEVVVGVKDRIFQMMLEHVSFQIWALVQGFDDDSLVVIVMPRI